MTIGDRLKSWAWALRSNRKAQVVLGIVLVLMIAGVAGALVFRGDSPSEQGNENTNGGMSTGEALVRRAIDGVYDSPSRERGFPVAVIIENLVAARPQAGLDQANLVYETLAEGGITRFLAVFTLEHGIDKIGPVRSARPYFVELVDELGALFAHAGGSPTAMSLIRSLGLRDMDQMFNGPYYWRDTERQTAVEHTLYTSTKLIDRARADKDVPEVSTFTPWKYKDDVGASSRPSEQRITVPFSTFSYQAEWVYDKQQNDYVRYQAGTEHVMENGSAIRAKNVVVQSVKTSLADEKRLNIGIVGEGTAVIFRDGQRIDGTWQKADADSRTTYRDATGQEVQFNAGTTWVELLPTDRSVEVT